MNLSKEMQDRPLVTVDVVEETATEVAVLVAVETRRPAGPHAWKAVSQQALIRAPSRAVLGEIAAELLALTEAAGSTVYVPAKPYEPGPKPVEKLFGDALREALRQWGAPESLGHPVVHITRLVNDVSVTATMSGVPPLSEWPLRARKPAADSRPDVYGCPFSSVEGAREHARGRSFHRSAIRRCQVNTAGPTDHQNTQPRYCGSSGEGCEGDPASARSAEHEGVR